MSFADRIVTALGGTPRTALPALVAREVEAQTRSVVSTYGEAFARGIEQALQGGQPLRRFGRPEFSTHALIYACVTLIAEAVAAVPFKLWKRQPDGTPGDQVAQHPLLDALSDPFPELYPSFPYFVELMVMYGLCGGNFWILPDDAVRSKTRIPLSFALLGRQHVRPYQNPQTWRLVYWDVHWGAQPKQFAPDALDHFKRPNPDDPSQILGVGELEAARRDVNADFARQVYDEQFFVNGAAPSAVLHYNPSTDQRQGANALPASLKPDDLKAAAAAFADKHAGAEKAQKIAALNAGWTLEKFGVSQRDMEWVEASKDKLRRIAMTFRVPSVLLNDREHGGLSQEEIKGAYTQLAMAQTMPWCRRLSAFFQRVFVDRYAPGLLGGFDTDEIDALKVNFDKKVENFGKLVSAQISPKAANDLVDLGLDPATLSDEPLVPFSLTKLSDVLADDPEPAPLPVLPPGAPSPTADSAEAKPLPADVDRKVILVAPSAIRRVVSGRAEAQREARRLQQWRAFVAGLTPLERKFHKAVRKYVFALRAETLANLAESKVAAARMRGVDDDVRKILFNERAADARLRDLAAPFFREAVQIGAASAAADLDADPIGLEAPGMVDFLELKELKVVGINDTIRDALRATLREGLSAGEAVNDLAGRVRHVFDVSASRARTIARTETAAAVSGSRFLEHAAQGVTEHEWLSARDAHVRESHAAMDGEVVTVGHPFSAGILYPGDVNAPAEEVINCFPADTLVRGEFLGGLRAPYAGPLVELRTRAGHRLRVTPNHPVLTPEGFVPAQSLRKGDHVLSQRRSIEAVVGSRPNGQGRSSLPGHHDVDHGPATIGEVLETLRQAGAHLRTKSPLALDLDGDGRFFHGDIEIVDLYGSLVHDVQATGTEGRRELGLVAAAAGEAILARAGHAYPALARDSASAGGCVGRQDITAPRRALGLGGGTRIGETRGGRELDVPALHFERRLMQAIRFGRGAEFDASLYELALGARPRQAELDREPLHRRAVTVALREGGQINGGVRNAGRGRVGAQRDARALQMAGDRTARSTMLARELADRHAGTIAADEIVEIRKDLPFVGHVYDLQASGGWMLANGIVASNCRCVAQPVNG